MAVIVNADDFGISHEVNLAICEAFRKGLITRTTLMVNMPFAKEAMEMATKEGFAHKVGIHLNLTAGRPLSDELASDRIICNETGDFSAEFARNLKTRFLLPADTSKKVEKELRLQLARYGELGGTLWHIDSHHHVHTDPSIWFVLKKVLPDFPVTGVRLGRNMYKGGNPLMSLYKKMFNFSVRKFCKTHSDYFGSGEDFETFFAGCKSEEFSNKNIEIMVHPMYAEDGTLRDTDAVLKQYM